MPKPDWLEPLGPRRIFSSRCREGFSPVEVIQAFWRRNCCHGSRRIEARQDRLREMIEASPVLLVLLPLLAIVVAPLVEEILFRGVLFEALSSALPTAAVIVVTAGIFALIHFNPPQMVAAFVLGLHCGLVRALFGSVGASIVVHLLNNVGSILVLAWIDGRPVPGVLMIPIVDSAGPRLRHIGEAAGQGAAGPDHRAAGGCRRVDGRPSVQATVDRNRALDVFEVADPRAAAPARFDDPPVAPEHGRDHGTDRQAAPAQPSGSAPGRAHGLAVALATLYALQFLAITSRSWRQTGSVTVAITAFFGFWAWGFWCERKARSVIFLLIFAFVRLASGNFGAWDLLAITVFILGIVAVFRGYHVQWIRHESLRPRTGESDEPDGERSSPSADASDPELGTEPSAR